MGKRVLVVDDDQKLCEMLRRALTFAGYDVEVARDGQAALDSLMAHEPDLVILDWMLPVIDGLVVCQRLRSVSSVRILMLTGKDAVEDRVTGLQTGADDYLIKPFALKELLARVEALLRRDEADSLGEAEVLCFGDVSLDTGTREAKRGERSIDLTTTEYELLRLFLRHPRQVLTREIIMERVWGYDFSQESNVLEVYIGYLRKKLEAAGEPRVIQTVRGAGYSLREA